jgi:hypothetical protein
VLAHRDQAAQFGGRAARGETLAVDVAAADVAGTAAVPRIRPVLSNPGRASSPFGRYPPVAQLPSSPAVEKRPDPALANGDGGGGDGIPAPRWQGALLFFYHPICRLFQGPG